MLLGGTKPLSASTFHCQASHWSMCWVLRRPLCAHEISLHLHLMLQSSLHLALLHRLPILLFFLLALLCFSHGSCQLTEMGLDFDGVSGGLLRHLLRDKFLLGDGLLQSLEVVHLCVDPLRVIHRIRLVALSCLLH